MINVLQDAAARAQKRQYNPNFANKNKGRPAILEDGTAEGILVCRALQRGIGITQATVQLNKY